MGSKPAQCLPTSPAQTLTLDAWRRRHIHCRPTDRERARSRESAQVEMDAFPGDSRRAVRYHDYNLMVVTRNKVHVSSGMLHNAPSIFFGAACFGLAPGAMGWVDRSRRQAAAKRSMPQRGGRH